MHHASLSADRQRTIGENLPSRAIVLRGRTPLGAFSYPFATVPRGELSNRCHLVSPFFALLRTWQ